MAFVVTWEPHSYNLGFGGDSPYIFKNCFFNLGRNLFFHIKVENLNPKVLNQTVLY